VEEYGGNIESLLALAKLPVTTPWTPKPTEGALTAAVDVLRSPLRGDLEGPLLTLTKLAEGGDGLVDAEGTT
jgi:hypothetical protein